MPDIVKLTTEAACSLENALVRSIDARNRETGSVIGLDDSTLSGVREALGIIRDARLAHALGLPSIDPEMWSEAG